METKHFSAKIRLVKSGISLEGRAMFFCFGKQQLGEKCETAKILKVVKEGDEFKIDVKLIDRLYVKDELYVNNNITIREASRIQAEGYITEVVS